MGPKLSIGWRWTGIATVLRGLVLPSLLALSTVVAAPAAQAGPLEKDELKLGFIKLTDMAPLAIAKEKGFFEDEGLYVTLEPQANWKVLLDRVITGELDGAHMLAGQPLAATIGYRHQGRTSSRRSRWTSTATPSPSRTRSGTMMKPQPPERRRRQAGASDQGRGAEAGGRQVQGRGQAVQHGHGVPGLDPQLRAALLARRRRHPPRLLLARRYCRADPAPTC